MSVAEKIILMEIRDELKALNRLFNCPNFRQVPYKLDQVILNTKKPKRKKPVTQA